MGEKEKKDNSAETIKRPGLRFHLKREVERLQSRQSFSWFRKKKKPGGKEGKRWKMHTERLLEKVGEGEGGGDRSFYKALKTTIEKKLEKRSLVKERNLQGVLRKRKRCKIPRHTTGLMKATAQRSVRGQIEKNALKEGERF